MSGPRGRRRHAEAEEAHRRATLALARPDPGARMLDLGCGDGAMTARLAVRVGAGVVCAAEREARQAARARARGIDVVAADLREPLPWPDGAFDVVHAAQVIEHLVDTGGFLAEVRRVLAPGGQALLSTNNLASWHNIASLVLGLQPPPCHVSEDWILGNPLNPADGDPGAPGFMHLRLFTGPALTALAARHGLRRTAARAAGFYPLAPRAARVACRLDPRHGAFLVHRYAPTPP